MKREEVILKVGDTVRLRFATDSDFPRVVVIDDLPGDYPIELNDRWSCTRSGKWMAERSQTRHDIVEVNGERIEDEPDTSDLF